jgi:hypothetical protein
LSRPQIEKRIRQVLHARVGLLLGQTTFEQLLPLQEQVALELARGVPLWHASEPQDGAQELAQAMVDAFGLDPLFYSASSLDFLVSEGLTSASLALADAVRGHERDSLQQWQQADVCQDCVQQNHCSNDDDKQQTKPFSVKDECFPVAFVFYFLKQGVKYCISNGREAGNHPLLQVGAF